MHLKVILAASAALIAPALAQSSAATLVVNDIISLDSDVQTLTAAVEAYEGGVLVQGAPLLLDLTNVLLATQKGADDADLLPQQLSVADANSIIQTVNDTLAVDNPIAVAALEAKKSYFQAEGLDSFIQASLEQLLREHLEFGENVLPKVPLSLLSDAEAVTNVITDALENGIAYFDT